MILFATKPDTNVSPDGVARPHTLGWRWVLHTEGIGLGWSMQYQDAKTKEWQFMSTSYYMLCLTKHFHLGSYHGYYDGPHCSWSLGFLHYNWSGNWCTKCFPENT